MLKIFFRNTLWRKYNSWRYSLHLILWLQKVSLKTKYTSENMNKVRTLSTDYEWMIKEKHEFQMFFATIMLLFHFSSRIEFFGLSVIVIKKTNYHPFNENHSQYMFFFRNCENSSCNKCTECCAKCSCWLIRKLSRETQGPEQECWC